MFATLNLLSSSCSLYCLLYVFSVRTQHMTYHKHYSSKISTAFQRQCTYPVLSKQVLDSLTSMQSSIQQYTHIILNDLLDPSHSQNKDKGHQRCVATHRWYIRDLLHLKMYTDKHKMRKFTVVVVVVQQHALGKSHLKLKRLGRENRILICMASQDLE